MHYLNASKTGESLPVWFPNDAAGLPHKNRTKKKENIILLGYNADKTRLSKVRKMRS